MINSLLTLNLNMMGLTVGISCWLIAFHILVAWVKGFLGLKPDTEHFSGKERKRTCLWQPNDPLGVSQPPLPWACTSIAWKDNPALLLGWNISGLFPCIVQWDGPGPWWLLLRCPPLGLLLWACKTLSALLWALFKIMELTFRYFLEPVIVLKLRAVRMISHRMSATLVEVGWDVGIWRDWWITLHVTQTSDFEAPSLYLFCMPFVLKGRCQGKTPYLEVKSLLVLRSQAEANRQAS